MPSTYIVYDFIALGKVLLDNKKVKPLLPLSAFSGILFQLSRKRSFVCIVTQQNSTYNDL